MTFSCKAQAGSIEHVAFSIQSELKKGRTVLWLVSGGSAIQLQVAIMNRVAKDAYGKLDRLSILPVDERYGPPGHADSNSEQMRRAGFAPTDAQWFDVLVRGDAASETIEYYEKLVEDGFAKANTVIATLGLGADGHTAGVLPGSPAAEDTVSAVISYEWNDYVRMTLGLDQLRQIDSAFVFAYGDAKCAALKRLQAGTEPATSLPSKVLYDIPNVTVYNDCITSEE